MISAGAAASTASAMKIGSVPAAPGGAAWIVRPRHAAIAGGHSTGCSARRGIEPLQHVGARPLRLEQEDVLDQAGHRRRRLRLVERRAHRRPGIPIERIRLEVEREIDARELAVELLREIGGARAQARAHPLALRLAHFAEPAVLQRRERDQQHR